MTDSRPDYLRSDELLSRDDSRLLIVDVQEKLVPLVVSPETLVEQCERLLRVAGLLGIRITATEQYPDGLGSTVAALASLVGSPVPKHRFSSVEALGWQPAAECADGREKVVVAGIEAHVCVMQTVLDLLALGYQVYVPADAVSSRHRIDWEWALQRMRDSGAVVTTTEAVLFEWCERSDLPEFRELLELIKQRDEKSRAEQ